MRISNASFIEESQRVESQGIRNLYRVQVCASPVQYEYWAGYNATVNYFQPRSGVAQAYTPADIGRGDIEEGGAKEPSLVLSVGGVDQQVLAYIESNDALRGLQVDHITAMANALTNASACIVDTYYIDGAVVDHKEERAEFQMSSKGAVADVTVPIRRFRRNLCSWVADFKGAECKYAGVDTTCNGTKADCKSKSNLLNFGGWPGLGTKKVVY